MLRLDHVSKTYPNGTVALQGVNISVSQGEIVSFVGGSGCGKTTLLRAIAGLDVDVSGRIDLDGEIIHAPHPSVGMIFQEPRLFPWLTVAENVGFGLASIPENERQDRVSRLLARLGLEGYGPRWPRELSGGQAQRVAIARALIMRPRVLLLDEPFSALDAFTRASLHRLLISLWETDKPTLLLVTHDVDEAVALGDRVIVMQPRPGRIFSEIGIRVARPRDMLSPDVTELKRRILAALDGSLQTSIPQQATTEAIGGYW